MVRGDTACVWGASSGNLAWEMLRIVGRHGHVWAQEPDPRRTHEAPPHNDYAVCVIDWLPMGRDFAVLEHIRTWPLPDTVRSIMTELNTPEIRAWMDEHGFQEATDSRRYHAWWDRKDPR